MRLGRTAGLSGVGLIGAVALIVIAVVVSDNVGRQLAEATPRSSLRIDDGSAGTDADASCSEVPDPSAGAGEVLVYFTCEHPPADPRPVVRDAAGADSVEARMRVALRHLLAGPTAAEAAAGYFSVFPPGSQDLLIGVELVDGGLAIIDFADELRTAGPLNASTPRFMVFASLTATFVQFDDVAAIQFRIEGSCERFARHFETTCEPWR